MSYVNNLGGKRLFSCSDKPTEYPAGGFNQLKCSSWSDTPAGCVPQLGVSGFASPARSPLLLSLPHLTARFTLGARWCKGQPQTGAGNWPRRFLDLAHPPPLGLMAVDGVFAGTLGRAGVSARGDRSSRIVADCSYPPSCMTLCLVGLRRSMPRNCGYSNHPG